MTESAPSPQLVQMRCAGADRPTFAELFETHHDFVWRSLARLGVPLASVDDAAQDVFVVVHKRFDEIRPEAPLRPWLYGIARRIGNRHRTRAARHADLRVVTPTGPPSPERRVAVLQAEDWVLAVLESLEPTQREVFMLAELEGMRAPEVAVAVGAKLNTVYSRLRLARERFERALARRQRIEQRQEVVAQAR